MSKITWYLKQLLPLTYVSSYWVDEVLKVSIWKMWFGRCYQIRDY